jgi:hypothetical protein
MIPDPSSLCKCDLTQGAAYALSFLHTHINVHLGIDQEGKVLAGRDFSFPPPERGLAYVLYLGRYLRPRIAYLHSVLLSIPGYFSMTLITSIILFYLSLAILLLPCLNQLRSSKSDAV